MNPSVIILARACTLKVSLLGMSVPEFISMDQQRGYSREIRNGSVTLQKKMVETTRRRTSEPVPDLTDFINDMFFGTTDMGKKTYDLTGASGGPGPGPGPGPILDEYGHGFDDSTRSNRGRLTQEWLEEARRIVAASPSRSASPSRLYGSPRFAVSQPTSSIPPSLERDPLSRSARRKRQVQSFSGDVLSKPAIHSRSKSHTFIPPPPSSHDSSPSMPLHKWFSIDTSPSSSPSHPALSTLPPRHSLPPKSRFQTQSSLPSHSCRTFRTLAPSPDAPSLSPSNHVSHPANSSSLLKSNSLPLSPPKNLVQSAHRRSVLSSTCSLQKIASNPPANEWSTHGEGTQTHCLNGFLKEQRILIHKVLNGELNTKGQIVLSGHPNSTTSMVAAICYAWLLGYRQRESGDGRECVVVPVMNVKRGAMWKLKQAAWLFHHADLDATSLLFADEMDMESIRMTGQLSILVVGQDILSTIGEVGSLCTILTDNYCEDAYDLLQNPVLKKLLLAGILLDTQNLKASTLFSMTRDSEAVQLLLVGSPPNYRYTLFDQLMQDQNATTFVEALNHNYGNHLDESEGNKEHISRERKSTSTPDCEVIIPSPKKNSTDKESAKTNKVSPKSAKLTSPSSQAPTPTSAPSSQAEKESLSGKNTFFLFKWFGFGPK
ncbi:uncharacterized protein G2W53_038184 [Senna tora]|uniref:Exopolyphosphatase n=1 Tax=Senna tora TaxID=362788 RepID=A0A834SNM6_9FABA|nr:uncharacterized protein G2W53_038184 [Senna tora]